MRASPRPASPANSSSSGMRAATARARQAEVAAVHQQVLGDGEVRIEVVELRHHADAPARLARARAAPARRGARSRRRPDRVRPRQRRSVVVLPAPFGPSRPKHSPGRDLEIERRSPLRSVAIALAQRRAPAARSCAVRRCDECRAGRAACDGRSGRRRASRTTGSSCGRAQSSTVGERHRLVAARRGSRACPAAPAAAAKRVTATPTSTSRSALTRCASSTCTPAPNEKPASTSRSRLEVLRRWPPGPRARRGPRRACLRSRRRRGSSAARPRSRARRRRARASAPPCCRACRRRADADARSARCRTALPLGSRRRRTRSGRPGRRRTRGGCCAPHILRRSTTRPCFRCSSMISSMSARST